MKISTLFQKLKTKEYLRGKADAEKSFQAIVDDMNKQFAEKIDMFATNKFCEHGYVNPLHVFQVSQSGLPYLGLEPITKVEATRLQENAKLLKAMPIWKIFEETIRQHALNKAIMQSKDWEEVLAGKMMLHNLGIIKSIVDTLDNLKIDKIPEGAGKQITL